MNPRDDTPNWLHAEMHVMSELVRLSDATDKLTTAIALLDARIARLEVKAGLWGAIGGAIPVSIALLSGWLKP